MNEPVRILLLDDNPDDRTLALRELRRQFSQATFVEATGAAQFQTIINDAPPDLVITDYQLRWTDGLAILHTVKQSWPNCPVVMFTGTGSEEIAVQAMKAGLDDYVLKSPKQFARLPNAARLALKLARQRLELQQAETRYRHLFNTVPVGLYRCAADGAIRDANRAFIQMLRYPHKKALLNSNFAQLYVDPAQFQHWRHLVESENTLQHFTALLRCYDGSTCWVQNNARALRHPQNNTLTFEGSLEDVFARKEAEIEREKLIEDLQDALAKIKTLNGLLPICAACKKIRDDQGYLNQLEVYIEQHSDAEFTHSFCPDCISRLYPEVVAATENHPAT